MIIPSGSLEVTDVQKPEDNRLSVNVRVARPGSFAWCGVVQAGKTGKPLKADLTPDLLKKYGVRSPEASKTANEIINIEIRNVLKKNSAYDLYCYSEVIGDKIEGELEQFKQEIAASRTRISTDREAPQLSDISVVGTFHSANVTFTIDEPSSVWCVGIHVTDKGRNDVLFGPSGPLEGISESTRSGDIQRMLHYFQTSGEGIDVAIDGGFGERPIRKTIVVSALIPDSDYNIYCYAEDHAEPEPNRMTADQVNATMQSIRTQAKIPTVRIARRQTLHRGFRLFVTGDAPGRAWCAAAPTDYGVPDVSEILGVGAMAEIKNPGKEVPIDVRGVEPNTAYIVYCIGGNSEETAAESGGLHEYSSSDEMIANSVSLVSYGRYCEEGEGPEIVKTVQEFTPFHPVTAEEEMRVRNYVMGRSELGLEGVYRITLLPNKTEIKDFYMGRGPKPLRYARVRAGRCVNDAGLYEQFRVGPLNGDRPMSYERVAQPIETECGGYNPQGVFGRRLMDFEDWEAGTHKLSNWFKKTFGYEFGTENCRSEIEPLNKEEALIGSSSLRYPHSHDRECLEPGPVMIQEVCDETEEGVPCPSDSRGGRIWVGLKTPTGDQLPFYFIYELPETSVHSEKPPHKETAEEWVRRIIRNKELPDGFHEYWEVKEFWVNGQIFKSINEFLAAAEDGRIGQIDPKAIQERRRLETGKMFEEAKKERRQLQPHPYAGAAGTAGPLPSRQTRRGGLEYRAHPEHIESQGKRFQAEASSDDEGILLHA